MNVLDVLSCRVCICVQVSYSRGALYLLLEAWYEALEHQEETACVMAMRDVDATGG